MKQHELYGNIYEKGTTLFNQEDPGEGMYIIQNGAVQISRSINGMNVVLAQLEKGDFFGEMALISNQSRTASATTLCRSRLLYLTGSTLLERMKKDPGIALHLLNTISRRIEKASRLLLKTAIREETDDVEGKAKDGSNHVELIELNTDKEKMQILRRELIIKLQNTAGPEKLRHIAAGEKIFVQGSSGEQMYIIFEGAVEISRTDMDRTSMVATLGAGDFFGEIAILSDGPRSATARAISSTRVITISKEELLQSIIEQPEIGMLILQLMVVRLYTTITASVSIPDKTEQNTFFLPSLPASTNKAVVNFVSLAACSGCAEGLLQDKTALDKIIESVDISYSTLLTDHQIIGDADITIIDGAVRSREEEEKLLEVRAKSRFLVAWGTCAAYGGIPVYANRFELEDLIEEAYGQTADPFSYYLSGSKGVAPSSYRQGEMELLRRAGKADDVVKVDYYLPGCPPHISLLTRLVDEIMGNDPAARIPAIVCSECSRKPFKCPDVYSSDYPDAGSLQDRCFNAQGILCLGFITRGGCLAACPGGGLPCWACRGPSDISLKKMIAGEGLEKILIDSLASRCKLQTEQIMPLINNLCFKGNSMLRLDHYFTHQREKIR